MTNRDGGPVLPPDFIRKWRLSVEIAGLPLRTRLHDLRHLYTSQLGASGRHDPKTVQALTRHAEFSETWDTCARPPPAVGGIKVSALGGMFGDGDTSSPLSGPPYPEA